MDATCGPGVTHNLAAVARIGTAATGLALALAAVAGCGGGDGGDQPSGALALTDGPWSVATAAEPATFGDGELAGVRLTYTIDGADGAPVSVTGLVAVPDGAPPEDGWPVVAWAHGTTGVADACAPSVTGTEDSIGIVAAMVDRGFVVAATDYEGLGGDGIHPYLDGPSAARSVAGSVAAAAEVLDVPLADRWVVFGGSQGGHAALFTAELGPDAVDGMTLAGAVAVAPVTDLRANTDVAASDFARGVQALLLAGLLEREPGLDPATLLTEAGADAVATATSGCAGDLGGLDDELLRPGAGAPGTPYGDLLDAGTVPQAATTVPILVAQGTGDATVPAALTAEAVERLCALGDVVEHRTYEGDGHLIILQTSAADVLAWTLDRFAGRPPTSTC